MSSLAPLHKIGSPFPPYQSVADNCAKLFGFIQETPWARGIKLVPMTAEGLALPGFNYQLLQSLTPLKVETWADFSTRLVSGQRWCGCSAGHRCWSSF